MYLYMILATVCIAEHEPLPRDVESSGKRVQCSSRDTM